MKVSIQWKNITYYHSLTVKLWDWARVSLLTELGVWKNRSCYEEGLFSLGKVKTDFRRFEQCLKGSGNLRSVCEYEKRRCHYWIMDMNAQFKNLNSHITISEQTTIMSQIYTNQMFNNHMRMFLTSVGHCFEYLCFMILCPLVFNTII